MGNVIQYTVLDVFAEARLEGNPVAVFQRAGGLSSDLMQRIAREMNLSETTFILSDAPRDGGYDVRIFTPAVEVPFAGHPTLGTAYVIAHEVAPAPPPRVVLNLKVGPIPVTFENDGRGELLWMRQIQPEFGREFAAAEVAESLSLSVEDIDSRSPIQVVSTGLPFVLVPLRSLDAVRRARVRLDPFEKLVKDCPAKSVFVFTRETCAPANAFHARMFGPLRGVPEDPATGSANGCLAGYLLKHRCLGSDEIDYRVEQGYEIARPSLLHVRARRSGDSFEINVGGRVIPAARGELTV
jgi:trans-2,3-dihydro-3-hydroxyanthranilate isomerase